MKTTRNLANLAAVVVLAMGCASTPPARTDEALPRAAPTGCAASAHDTLQSAWMLGEPAGSAELWGQEAHRDFVVCIKDGEGAYLASARVSLAAGEVIATDACSFRGTTDRSVFATGRVAHGDFVPRQAWKADVAARRLEPVAIGDVACIYTD